MEKEPGTMEVFKRKKEPSSKNWVLRRGGVPRRCPKNAALLKARKRGEGGGRLYEGNRRVVNTTRPASFTGLFGERGVEMVPWVKWGKKNGTSIDRTGLEEQPFHRCGLAPGWNSGKNFTCSIKVGGDQNEETSDQ